MKNLYLVIAILFAFTCNGWSQNRMSHEKITQQKKLYIFLLIGQSNMAGRAPWKHVDGDSLKNVYLFTGIEGQEWEKAANPLNKYSSVRKELAMQKLGPGYSFAKRISRMLHEKPVGLVVNARGGTSVNEWIPGAYLFNQAVERIKKAGMDGWLTGVIWHQGESDVVRSKVWDQDKQGDYMDKMVAIINGLRAETGIPDLPFVAGKLPGVNENNRAFNKMISRLPEMVPATGIVNSKGTRIFDAYHFDAKSQRLMGERFAEEILKLLNISTHDSK